MNHKFLFSALTLCLCLGGVSSAQDRDVIAGIKVNYDESKTGNYKATLPDPLVFNDGKPVTTAKQWTKRRAEVMRILQENQFGKWVAKKPRLVYDVQTDKGLDGDAVRKQLRLYFGKRGAEPYVDVLIYLPKDANGPVPLLLNLSFSPNNLTVSDPGVMTGRRWNARTRTMSPAEAGNTGRRRGGMDATIKKYLAEGFGFATLCYTDMDPDFIGGEALGVRAAYLKDGQTKFADDEWGTISAWAWGVSHVVDYFIADPDIDGKRIALTGCSRLGKTTLWTGACDERIAVVIPSCSGEGGAALSRRNFGETVAHLTEPTRFPYQFCANYGKWADKVDEMPMDSNMLISLIAPRPLLLQTGTTDNWSDPKGEFFAAVEAGKVWRLFGKDDLGTTVMPQAEQPIYHTLGYVMHEGGHGVLPQDWDYYLEFLKRYL